MVAVISVPGFSQEGNKFLIEESEILLAAQPGKWQKVFLRRNLHESKVVSYRWEYHLGDRDRMGQGAFTRTIECFLHAPAENVEIAIEPPLMKLKFTFHGQGIDNDSEIRVTAFQYEKACSVAFEGRGDLYKEFMERLEEIQKEGDDPTQELQWGITSELEKP
ncbi:MAG: hypothetical protein H7A52_16980 [Akkermansiaceae bacterium]|nr:hypothetical protein [Akkermansiaceae bacterium]